MDFLWFLVLFLLTSVDGQQMDWGYNADLVEEADTIQGREHIKLVVLLEGDSIDLECQVAFTSNPVSEIRWTVDGKGVDNTNDATVVTRNGEVYVEEHLRIENISAEKDGSTVACNYSKGQYGASVEAVFRVFRMAVELSEDLCDTCEGDVKLVFKESTRASPAEANVDKRIKDKIGEVTKSQEIQVDNLGYSVSLPLNTVMSSRFLKEDVKLARNGITQDQCRCRTEFKDVKEKPLQNIYFHPGICLAVAVTIVVAFVIGGILVKKCLRWKRENDYWRGYSTRDEEIGGYMKLRQGNGENTVYFVI